MRKTVDDRIRIMVSAASVPATVNSGIGRKLYHSKRDNCSWKSVAMASGSYHWINILRVILCRNDLSNIDGKCNKPFFHVLILKDEDIEKQ